MNYLAIALLAILGGASAFGQGFTDWGPACVQSDIVYGGYTSVSCSSWGRCEPPDPTLRHAGATAWGSGCFTAPVGITAVANVNYRAGSAYATATATGPMFGLKIYSQETWCNTALNVIGEPFTIECW